MIHGIKNCRDVLHFLVVSITIYFAAFSHDLARGALLPPDFLSAVVALGDNQIVQDVGQPPRTRWVTEGTGFLYGYLVKDSSDQAEKRYAVFLVTAGHVIRGKSEKGRTSIRVRLDKTATTAQAEDLELPLSNWFFHSDPQIDLAAVSIPISYLRDNGFQSGFFTSDAHAMTKDRLKEIGVSVGDGVFILGFPMSLTGEQRNYTIVRQGSIARISEFLDGASKDFLVDAFVFPGNSGGPVVLKPDISAIQGTKSNQRAAFIGVVKSYLPYTDIAFSHQTNRPRITFEENSGLAAVVPVDYLDAMLKDRAEAIWKFEQGLPKPQ